MSKSFEVNYICTSARLEPALFLDVDGTLLDVAPTPDAVEIPPQLPELLLRLMHRLNGALALVSGRPLQELDRLFAPYQFCGACSHGGELRAPGITDPMAMVDQRLVATIHDGCRVLVNRLPGVLIEYKAFGAAIHYRLAPEVEPVVAAYASKLRAEVGEGFELQPGKCVYEIKPAGFSKGTGIGQLMSVAPFASRCPIFIGDDATDEHGFGSVNRLGGVSIKVGHEGPSVAHLRVATPTDVRRLLARIHESAFLPLTGVPDWLESLITDKIAAS